MAASETAKIGGRTFTACRLTVAQIRELLQEIEASPNRPLDLVEYLVEDSLPAKAFYLSLDLKGAEDLDTLESAEDVVTLMEMVAKVNPTFAEAEKRELKRVREQASLLQAWRTSVPTLSSSVSAKSGTTTTTTSSAF